MHEVAFEIENLGNANVMSIIVDKIMLNILIDYHGVSYELIRGYMFNDGHNPQIKETIEVLEGIESIKLNRELMGATNPAEAESGTIRADFASSIDANAVHGSDSPKSARREIEYFFHDNEICS